MCWIQSKMMWPPVMPAALKKKEERRTSIHAEELSRVDGLVVAGHTEVDMGA